MGVFAEFNVGRFCYKQEEVGAYPRSNHTRPLLTLKQVDLGVSITFLYELQGEWFEFYTLLVELKDPEALRSVTYRKASYVQVYNR